MNINTNIAGTYLFTNKKLTAVAVMGVLLGMSVYIFMNSMLVGFDRTSNVSIFKSTPHIRVYKDDEISKPLSYSDNKKSIMVNPKIVPGSNKILNYKQVIEVIKKHKDVTMVTPQVTTSVFYSTGKVQIPGMATGVIPQEANIMFSIEESVIEGNFENLRRGINSIAVGSGVAEKLSLVIGDNLALTSSKGIVRNMNVVAIFKTNNAALDKSKAYINLPVAQQLLKENNSYITDINVSVTQPENSEKFAPEIANLSGYQAEGWKQANEALMAAFRMRKIVITFVSTTILIVAGFGIYNILNMTVSQKINDIAILKAMGFKGKDVITIFLSQALSIGFMGVLGGVGIATLLITMLKKVYLGGDIGYFPIDYEPTKYLQGVIVGMVITFFAGYLPAKKAAGVDPVSIFRK
jgi:lipoprotein-releasing system permease protein